jgi:hypothetical protein
MPLDGVLCLGTPLPYPTLLCKCYVEDENIRPILADETSSGSRSNLVAIIAGIDVCDIGHEFWVRAVFQIQGWHLELIGITSPVLPPQGRTNGAGKGFPYSATWKLYDCHLAFSENAALAGRGLVLLFC